MDLSTVWTAASYLGTGLGGAFLSKVVDAASEARRRRDEASSTEAARDAESRQSEIQWLRDQIHKLEGRIEQLNRQLDHTQDELALSREKKAVLALHVQRLEVEAHESAEREKECLRLNQLLATEVTSLRTRFQDFQDSVQSRQES